MPLLFRHHAGNLPAALAPDDVGDTEEEDDVKNDDHADPDRLLEKLLADRQLVVVADRQAAVGTWAHTHGRWVNLNLFI